MDGRVRLLTMNLGLLKLIVWGKTRGEVPFRQERLARTIPALAATGADILCLQEVFARRHRRTLIEGLKKDYPFVVDHAPWERGRSRIGHGLLILAKHPTWNSRFVRFGARPLYDALLLRRGVLATSVKCGPLGWLNILNVHTTAGGLGKPEGPVTEWIRGWQLAEMHAVASDYAGPTLVCGDFNAGPEASPANYQGFLALGYSDPVPKPSQEGPSRITWDPSNSLNRDSRFQESPPQQVDHVLLNRVAADAFCTPSVSTMFEEPIVPVDNGEMITLSDHYGLLVELSATTPTPS